MTLGFLSPGSHAGSAIGKVELRGDVASFDADRIVRLTPRRAVVLCADAPALVADARAAGLRAYDVTGSLTAVPVESETLLRRLTDVEVDAPTALPVAYGVPALVFPLGEGRYELFVPQELAQHIAQVVAGLEDGLG